MTDEAIKEELANTMRINAVVDQIITLQQQQEFQINQLLQVCNDALVWYKEQIKQLGG